MFRLFWEKQNKIAKKYGKDYQKEFEKQAERLEPLKWEHDGLVIIPAKSEQELIVEGKVLGHCVGGYGESHCQGNSIFFVRHRETPDIPFFTLQLDTKTGRVLQNRGRKNCDRTKEVQEFEKQWLAVIVSPWIQKKVNAAKNTARK